VNPDSSQLFRKILRVGVSRSSAFTLIFYFWPPPKRRTWRRHPGAAARMMIGRSRNRRPPRRPVVEQPKPKPEPEKKLAMVKPRFDVKQQAREKAQKQLKPGQGRAGGPARAARHDSARPDQEPLGAVGQDSHASAT